MTIVRATQFVHAQGSEARIHTTRHHVSKRIAKFQLSCRSRGKLLSYNWASQPLLQDAWCLPGLLFTAPRAFRCCQAHPSATFAMAGHKELILQVVKASIKRIAAVLETYPLVQKSAPALGLIMFAAYGLDPLARFLHENYFKLIKEDQDWNKSHMKHILVSYVRPLLLWTGVTSICRAFDPLKLSCERSQAMKERLVHFVRSLSTVLAFAICTQGLVQQVHEVIHEQEVDKNLLVQTKFIGNAIHISIWLAAVCLFMELLGFCTQKIVTAGGLGTIFLSLAGREIFTNFLSSFMIHATRPFAEDEWIQTKMHGEEISGTIEHLGWWSPTVIRGEDREAVHVPNNKFTVSVVRNLSQKSHWRIKTHFGISYYDVGKVAHIVSDMRKVLANYPQIEQKRLHRRVFLDNIDTTKQALQIMVSCFVTTPHFEEYLQVKEMVLADFLKVISHHNARLATPMRSIERMSDINFGSASSFPDADDQNHRHSGMEVLLVESSVLINQGAGSQPSADPLISKDKRHVVNAQTSSSAAHKTQLEGMASMGLNPKDITLLGAAFGMPASKVLDVEGSESAQIMAEKSLGTIEKDSSRQEQVGYIGKLIAVKEDDPEKLQDQEAVHAKLIVIEERVSVGLTSSIVRPQSVEENLVLSVALDGSRRTLPLDNALPSCEEDDEYGHVLNTKLIQEQHNFKM